MAVDPSAPIASAPPPVVEPVVPTTRSRSSAALNVLLGLALVVAVGGVAFAVGRVTAPAAAAGTGAGRGLANGNGNGQFLQGPNASGAPGRGGLGQAGGLSIQGTVEAVSATSLTLKTASGQTIEIALTPSTTYHERTAASATDVTTGSTVVVQLEGGRFPGGGGGGPTGSGAPTASGSTGGAGFGSASTVTVVPAGG
jgi:hypothetical protein